MAEWLRRLTRNQIPSGSVGSNPTDCGEPFLLDMAFSQLEFIANSGASRRREGPRRPALDRAQHGRGAAGRLNGLPLQASRLVTRFIGGKKLEGQTGPGRPGRGNKS